MRIAFLKGHGTENDFVIVPDPENVIDLPGRRRRPVRPACGHRG